MMGLFMYGLGFLLSIAIYYMNALPQINVQYLCTSAKDQYALPIVLCLQS